MSRALSDQIGKKDPQPRQGQGKEQEDEREIEEYRSVTFQRHLYEPKGYGDADGAEQDDSQPRKSPQYTEPHLPGLVWCS